MARQKDVLQIPKVIIDQNDVDRDKWIEAVCADFVAIPSNKAIYRVVLETLWPRGHGIPGPYVKEAELREQINGYRLTIGKKEYHDPFRRIRELQGEEGFLGIVKEGKTYQLVDLTVQPKRIRREALAPENWAKVLVNYHFRCVVCGRDETEVSFEQDHKVPRLRGGGNELTNWQPLCTECNNFKSTACRGCELDCYQCAWAFPEKFAPLKISGHNIERLRELASESNEDVHKLVNNVIEQFFQAHSSTIEITNPQDESN